MLLQNAEATVSGCEERRPIVWSQLVTRHSDGFLKYENTKLKQQKLQFEAASKTRKTNLLHHFIITVAV